MAFLDSLKYRVKQAALIGGVGLAALTGRGQSNTPEENTIDAFTPDRIEALGRMMGYDLQNTLNQEGGLPLTKETAVWPDPNDPNTMYEMDETGNPISKIEFKPDANGNMQAIRQNMRNDGGYDGPVVGSEPRGPNITDYTDSDEYNDTNQETDSAQTSQDTPTVEPPAPARRKSKMSFFSNVGGPHSTDYYYDDNGKLTPHNPDEPGQSQTDQASPSNGTDNAGSDAPAAKPDGYDAAYNAPTTDMTGATNAPAAPQQPYHSDQDVLDILNWRSYLKNGDTAKVSVSPEREADLQDLYETPGLSLDDITKQGGIPVSEDTYLLRDENDPTKFYKYNRFTNELEGTNAIRNYDGKIYLEERDPDGNLQKNRSIDTTDGSYGETRFQSNGQTVGTIYDDNGDIKSIRQSNYGNPITTAFIQRPIDGVRIKTKIFKDEQGNNHEDSTYRDKDGHLIRKVGWENGEINTVAFPTAENEDIETTYIRDKDNPDLWTRQILGKNKFGDTYVTETGKDGKPVYYKLDETKLGTGLAFTQAVEQNSVQDTKATDKPTARKSGKMQDILKSHSMPVKPNFVPGMDGSSRTNRVDRVNVAAPAGSQTTFVPTPALLKALGDKKQK